MTDPNDDPILGDDGYPHQIEIDRIKGWLEPDGALTFDNMVALMAYVKRRWKYAEFGYWTEHIDKDGSIFYQISTGGWSGNEEIMGAIHESPFWWICWESNIRGGHYVFHLPATMKSRD
jgi:hypothetical protein